jgi:hypothetical protein
MTPKRLAACAAAAIFALVAATLSFGRQPAAIDDPLKGMTPDQVRARLGQPERIQRIAVQGMFLEQWSYNSPTPTYINFRLRSGNLRPIVVGQYTAR